MKRRKLTTQEKRLIRSLVRQHCANYDTGQRECLPLECECPMFGKFYTGNYCRYFETSVLPLNEELAASLAGQETKPCKVCKKPFVVKGRKTYCSDACARIAEKAATAARVRKHRKNEKQDVTG